ncbi:MAG: uridine kinase [Flavobacteriales bacterium]|nr:uridine kinase [Flavobacteriales bacterium]
MAYIIGIAGGSASGKTTFIHQLKQTFLPEELAVISQDHYYKPFHEQVADENGEVNFDLPESIDMKRFREDIEKLESGEMLEIKEYTFNHPGKEAEVIKIQPAEILVVEGLFIFEHAAISDKLDLKLFIDADEEVKYKRRLKRDKLERGLTENVINYQWENHVKPSYEKYLLPHKGNVDMVIMNNTHFNNSLKVLLDHMTKVVKEKKPGGN